MKITANRNELIAALSPAMCAVSTKNTNSAAEGVLIKAGDDACTLTTYDFEKGYHIPLNAEIERPGSYIISASKLFQIVKVMPAGDIVIDIGDKNAVTISGGKTSFSLHAMPGSDFPSLPVFEGDTGFTIKASELKKLITGVAFSMPSSDLRPILNGMYFEVEGGSVRAVTCDSNRLSIRRAAGVASECTGERKDPSFIIPTKTMGELTRLLSDDEDVSMELTYKHVIFRIGKAIFFSRLIVGDYLNYESFFPSEFKTTAEVEARPLAEAVERALLVSEDKTPGFGLIPLMCSFSAGAITIDATSANSKIHEEIDANIEGEGLNIAFSCRLLAEALRNSGEGRIRISLNSALSGVVITPINPDEDGEFRYLVLPTKV